MSATGRFLGQGSRIECACVCVTECEQVQQQSSAPTVSRIIKCVSEIYSYTTYFPNFGSPTTLHDYNALHFYTLYI